MTLALSPACELGGPSAELRAQGRTRIRDFLTPASAVALGAHLTGHGGWRHVLNDGEKLFEIPAADVDAFSRERREALDAAVHAGAATRFQFRFDTIRVPDERDRWVDDDPIHDFARLMNAPATLAMLREVTGAADIGFADCQATRYRGGDFLTLHDDEVAGKDRLFAYVLGLSPEWQADWGGLLLFTDRAGELVDAYLPRFNQLSLFRVGQPHSVGLVAPFAGAPRLSLTGWLRRSA